ncbi:MAG TPA: FIST C-terminal domain-containing protein [Burkholderiaceae bacterium]|nr:FIST C-terminal domain-containing protein [Burkholderiaceae bacterium]
MNLEILRWQPDRGWSGDPASSSATLPPADLVLYFGATDRLTDGAPYRDLRERFRDAPIAGCSAGSQIVDADIDDDLVVAVAIRFAGTRVRAFSEPITAIGESHGCGVRLATRLLGPGLQGPGLHRSGPQGPDLAGVLVLSDGLSVNGTHLLEGLVSVLGETMPISGGLAGDGARFERTLVGLDEPPAGARVVAIGFYGASLRIGQAAVGGWDAFGPPRRITRSSNNVLFELDGSPALDLYERYLGDEATGLPGTALLYPLQIWDPAHPEDTAVRTVLSIDHDVGSMTFAGDLPQGWSAQLMRGTHARLIRGAGDAAAHALDSLGADAEVPALALLISCVGRRLLMGQRTADEVEAVAEALGADVAQIGFYSYGEIAPRERQRKCDLHNQTMTVTLIAEAAV